MAQAMPVRDAEAEEILRRLRRVEGQVQGLQRMLAAGRDCAEIAQQVAAARAALGRIAVDLLASGMEKCVQLEAAGKPRGRASLDRLRKVFQMLN
jgi:DNA-binding FrmR family transcriptional regulator